MNQSRLPGALILGSGWGHRLVGAGLRVLVGLILLTACMNAGHTPAVEQIKQPPLRYAGKKIVWIDSYHKGNPWNDGIGQGIKTVLAGTGVELAIFRMDSARHSSEQAKKQAALKAKAFIQDFEPDLVIASDDNAQTYLIVPYYKNTDLPVIFCGVNWDASVYGYPAPNVTGMIEVDLIPPLVNALKEYAQGDRVAYLSGDTETQWKVTQIYNERFFEGQLEVRLVKTFAEFKKEFILLQDEADILLTGNYVGIEGWDDEIGQRFMVNNTTIPTGYVDGYMTPFVLLTMGKIPEEQGRYAAETALKIFDGAKPADFPVVTNKQAVLGLNLEIAQRLDIVFTPSILRNAQIIYEED